MKTKHAAMLVAGISVALMLIHYSFERGWKAGPLSTAGQPATKAAGPPAEAVPRLRTPGQAPSGAEATTGCGHFAERAESRLSPHTRNYISMTAVGTVMVLRFSNDELLENLFRDVVAHAGEPGSIADSASQYGCTEIRFIDSEGAVARRIGIPPEAEGPEAEGAQEDPMNI